MQKFALLYIQKGAEPVGQDLWRGTRVVGPVSRTRGAGPVGQDPWGRTCVTGPVGQDPWGRTPGQDP